MIGRRPRAVALVPAALAALVLSPGMSGRAAPRLHHQPELAAPVALVAARTKKRTKEQPAKAEKRKAAPDARVWTFTSKDGLATLQFGVPKSDTPVISISCQPAFGLMRVDSFVGSRGLRPGDSAPLRMSNGSVRFEVAAVAVLSENKQSVDVGGATKIDPALFALFRNTGWIVLEVPGRKVRLPLRTIGSAAQLFEKACGARG